MLSGTLEEHDVEARGLPGASERLIDSVKNIVLAANSGVTVGPSQLFAPVV
jgi:hypothetical protein